MRTPHIGVQRPDRPRRVVAEAEARVIRHELSRRLGDVVVDLRIDGDPLPPWQPMHGAAWPTSVDAIIDADRLWSPELPPLTCLFGRTVDGAAAEVRLRMLRHLGVVPDEPFELDEARLGELEAWHITPTDLWLVARNAMVAATNNPAIDGLADDGRTPEPLDAVFDAIVGEITTETIDATHEMLQRVIVERDTARQELADATDQLARERAETADRLDDLLAENSLLRERLEQSQLRRKLDTPAS